MIASRGVAKRVAFSLVPLLALIVAVEVLLRVTGLASSQINSRGLPDVRAGVSRLDEELFWSLRPDQVQRFQGVTVTTNGHGLRCDEIDGKRAGEFRIMSLGGSSTFGAGVEDDETFSALLQEHLAGAAGGGAVRVINAAVSAYTSFQSLKYVELRGLELEPDLLLVCPESNDLLPTHLRDGENNIVGMTLSDKQRYEARGRRFHRWLMSVSAIYRFASFRGASRRMEEYQLEEAQRDRPTWAYPVGGDTRDLKFPVRVTEEERAEILAEFLAICRTRGIRLVVVHPARREPVEHDCLLVRFSAEHGVPLFDARAVLPPAGEDPDRYFWDPIHPTALGHAVLARELARFLVERGLVPGEFPRGWAETLTAAGR